MTEKKSPQKPTNLKSCDCDLFVNGHHFTKLEISPYYEKHNREYLESLERKKIKLTTEELSEKLITDELIKRTLLPQLNKKEVKQDGDKYYHWTYYSFRVFRGIKAYKLVWCLSDNKPNKPNILDIMNCYRQRKFDKKSTN